MLRNKIEKKMNKRVKHQNNSNKNNEHQIR
jgi:hypothetical protein